MGTSAALVLLGMALVVAVSAMLVVIGGTRPRTPDIPRPAGDAETAVSETGVSDAPFVCRRTEVYVGCDPLPKDTSKWTVDQKKAVIRVGDWVWIGKRGVHRWRVKKTGESSVTIWRFAEGPVSASVRRKTVARVVPWGMIRFSSHTGRGKNNRKA